MFLLLLVACGGSNRKEVVPDMTDPAWATEYAARADSGCTCADAACLDAAHADLTAMVGAHGGLDDAPPGVHTAHGKFDKCWREGTLDIGRDFTHVADTICTCSTAECLRLARIEMAGLVDGKYRDDFEAKLLGNATAKTAAERAAGCIDKLVMPAAAALAAIEAAADAACACKDLACTQAAMGQRDKAMAGYVDIDPSIDTTKVKAATDRMCGCFAKAIGAEMKNLSPVPALTSVNVSMKCN
jgi:hypothetical protein